MRKPKRLKRRWVVTGPHFGDGWWLVKDREMPDAWWFWFRIRSYARAYAAARHIGRRAANRVWGAYLRRVAEKHWRFE